MVGLSFSKATAQSSGCGCWKFSQPGWGGDFCFCFVCKEACGEQVQGNLAHLCGLGYFGSYNPGASSFLTWSLGGDGQGATAEGGVTHATLASLNWVLL